MGKKLLSVVVPLYNEEGNLEALYQELAPVLTSLKAFNAYEIIMVNDGSYDNSLNIVKTLARKDKNVKVISFTRNYGHEKATYAGIMHAQGDAVVLIDADRQDPPELINEFEREYLNGNHIVYARRTKRLNETWLKKLTSKIFYPVFKFLTQVDLPRDVGDFCLLSKKALNCIKQMPEREIFVRGLIYWSGLKKKSVPFIRRSRGAGKTKYNYSKLAIFALENIISFSIVPIYVILFLSLFIIGFCFVGLFIAFSMRMFGLVVMTGWTSLIMSMLFLSATVLFCLSILGLYIGKIFQEVKQRPVFLIDEKVNFNTYETDEIRAAEKIEKRGSNTREQSHKESM